MPRFTLVATKAAPAPGSPALGPSAATGAASAAPTLDGIGGGKEWAGDLYEDTSEPPSDPTVAYASFTAPGGEQAWLDRAADGTLTGWVRAVDGSTYRYSDADSWAVDVDDAGMTHAGGTAPPPAAPAMDPAMDPAAVDPAVDPAAEPAEEAPAPDTAWEPGTEPVDPAAAPEETTEPADAEQPDADAEDDAAAADPADATTPDDEDDDEPDLWSFVAGEDEDDDEPEKRPAKKH